MSMFRELSYDEDIDIVVGVQFALLSPDEIKKRSVCEVVVHDLYNGSEPVHGGVLDMRMGVVDTSRRCPTCGHRNTFCPGHFGHIELAKPVFFVTYMDVIRKLLRCVCYRCSALAVDPKQLTPSLRKVLMKVSREKRFDAVYKLCTKSAKRDCPCCKARQPSTVSRELIIKMILDWKKDAKELAAAANDDNVSVDGNGAGVATATTNSTAQMVLWPEDVDKIFKRISDEDCELLGFSATLNRPEWMICSMFPVPPPCVRPTVHNDIGQRREDDLTHKICEIVKTNNTLKSKIAANSNRKDVECLAMLLQYHVGTYADNQLPGMPPSQHRNGRPIKSVTERLKSKEGRIRGNLMGKRVDFSARSVVTPDPNISIDELGVPVKIAMNLTFPEVVHPLNKSRLQQLVDNGPDVYPGARYVRKGDEMRTIRLVKDLPRGTVILDDGDVVDRHLINGDYVLFNRQPSLHKMSMMGHRVHVMPYDTFRLNPCVTPAYNADFDGDEMNAHVPQSMQTAVELAELAAVPLQIMSPRLSSPILTIVQDVALGVHRLSAVLKSVRQRVAFNMLSVVGSFNGQLESKNDYTGIEVLSHAIPKGIYVDTGKIGVNNGQIIRGALSKSVYSDTENGLIQSVFKELGPDAARRLMDDAQRMVCDWLCSSGFSVGISDLLVTDDVRTKMRESIITNKQAYTELLRSVHDGSIKTANDTIFSNKDYFENAVKQLLEKAGDEVAAMINFKDLNNRLVNMIVSGSKGKDINMLQMVGMLGQQGVEEDKKRVPYGFEGRTLPHFTKFDDSPEARGFVEHCFMEGLTPYEFFFHAMGGREGLIDTAVKSVTGDTPIVFMEDGVAQYMNIGDWIDAKLQAASDKVEHHQERQMELLHLDEGNDVMIPTTDSRGNVSWGKVTAVTRHDPGVELYEIKTRSGKKVIVTESKSLLVWCAETSEFKEMNTPDVCVGDFVPSTVNLIDPPSPVMMHNGIKMDGHNGVMVGIMLANGNKDPQVHHFVESWTKRNGEEKKQILQDMVGECHVPDVAFVSDIAFASGIITGYFSCMCVLNNDRIQVECANKRLADGMVMLCNRLGIFAQVHQYCQKHIVSVCGRWAKLFWENVELIDAHWENVKQLLEGIGPVCASPIVINDVALDKIVEINVIGIDKYPKVYDLTVPDTLNFGLANGLQVRDTSDTGYISRKLVKAMEDIKVAFDMTVRNVNNGIVQFAYGGDGFDSTRLELQAYPLLGMTLAEMKEKYLISTEDRPLFQAALITPAYDVVVAIAQPEYDKFFDEVMQDRAFFIKHVSKGVKSNNKSGSAYTVYFPINFPRILLYAHHKFVGDKPLPSDLDVKHVLEQIRTLGTTLRPNTNHTTNKMLGMMLRAYLNPKDLVIKGYTMAAFDYIIAKIKTAFNAALVHPSEMVGIVAAQSVSEPGTQMTLNTFHTSGVASVGKSVQGVPRLKELLHATKNMKSPQLKIFLHPAIANDLAKCQEVVNEIETTYMKDIVNESAIFYDPNDSSTDIDMDKDFVEAWNEFNKVVGCAEDASYSPWLLRFEFDRDKMLEKGLTMYDVYFAISMSLNENVSCIYSDDNSDKLVLRIRAAEAKNRDILYDIKIIEHQILNDLIIKGVMGIKKVVKVEDRFDNMTAVDDPVTFSSWREITLSTDGSNLVGVLAHPLVDKVRTHTNDIQEVYTVLGIEAARVAISNELRITLADLEVQDRHIELLLDTMCVKGSIMSIDRHGINRGDIGPLAKCSFEESAEKLIMAGTFADLDRVNGVSANVMLGQIPAAGTGASKVLMHLEKLINPYVDKDTHVGDQQSCKEGLEMLGFDFQPAGGFLTAEI